MTDYTDNVGGAHFTFGERLSALSDLISLIDRPGDFVVWAASCTNASYPQLHDRYSRIPAPIGTIAGLDCTW